jgi:hypothetical protein
MFLAATLTLLGCTDEGPIDTGYQPLSNGRPSILTLAISPDPPLAGQDLFALVEALDPDGDPIAVHFHWRLNDHALDITGDTVPGGTAIGGDELNLTVTLDDGFEYGDPVSTTVVYTNSAPVVDTVVITPAIAGVVDDLTCEATAHDDDGDETSIVFGWTVDGSDPGSSDAWLLGPFSKGTEIVCLATANDGSVTSKTVASDPVVIGNTPPGPPTIALDPERPSPCVDSGVVVLAQGEDPDGDSHSFRAEWTSESGSVVCTDLICAAGSFFEGVTYTVAVYGDDGQHEGEPALLSAVATPSGDWLGDNLDTDCDGAVDEWITEAWQAQGLYWSDIDSNQLGFALGIGDFDNDGRDDIAVAANGTHQVEILAAWDPDTPRKRAADSILEGLPAVSGMASGDVDGDGRTDLFLGVTGYDQPNSDIGALILISGDDLISGEGDDLASFLVTGEGTSDRLGQAVAVGDLNGDGYADLVAGQPYKDAPARGAGQVRVFLDLSATRLDDADWTLEGTNREIGFGSSLRIIPDMDGDGKAELLVGAPGEDSVAADGGVVALFMGGELGTVALEDARARIYGAQSNDLVGQQASAVGDIDGDGQIDLAISAFHDGGTLYLLSGVALLSGGDFGLHDAFATVGVDSSNAALGHYGLGPDLMDLDGDGQAELVAGASGNGRIFSWEGRDLTTDATQADIAWSIEQEIANDQLGRIVAFADTDGDGLGEVVSTAYRSDMAASRGGAVYVFRPPYDWVANSWTPECDQVGTFLYCRQPLDWDLARSTCRSHGLDLARFDQPDQATEAATGAADRALPATSRGGWWIGLTDRASEGTWAWLDETGAAGVTSWGSGEPGSDSGRNCALMNDQGEGQWADRACGDAYFFVCGE